MMDTEVVITFTGIALFLTDKDRVIVGVTDARRNCLDTADIPTHHAYVTYRKDQRKSGKAVMKRNGNDEAAAISGLVQFSGDIVEMSLTYPGTTPKLPNVIKTQDVAPAYTPLPTVTEDDPARIDGSVVAARIDLPYGTFDVPIATRSYWHFFPVKGSSQVRMQIAQAVVLRLRVRDGKLKVTEQPFGSNQPSEVVSLEAASGDRIQVLVGNSSDADIAPITVKPRPNVGPDFDFELHWNLFDRHADPECPPASYNEGAPTGLMFLTLGGGNCPPTQWP
jgi:hypothetical protein